MFSFYAYNYVNFLDNIQDYSAPMKIMPTVVGIKRSYRPINRLLPKGHRHRGDIRVAV